MSINDDVINLFNQNLEGKVNQSGMPIPPNLEIHPNFEGDYCKLYFVTGFITKGNLKDNALQSLEDLKSLVEVYIDYLKAGL